MGEYIHSQQVQFNQSRISCGVKEVHHLPADTTGNQMLFAVANDLYNKANGRPAAFVIWSDVIDRDLASRGERLAAFFVFDGNNFGSLTRTQDTINPKTGNIIVMWLFVIDHELFRAWYTDEFTNRVEYEI